MTISEIFDLFGRLVNDDCHYIEHLRSKVGNKSLAIKRESQKYPIVIKCLDADGAFIDINEWSFYAHLQNDIMATYPFTIGDLMADDWECVLYDSYFGVKRTFKDMLLDFYDDDLIDFETAINKTKTLLLDNAEGGEITKIEFLAVFSGKKYTLLNKGNITSDLLMKLLRNFDRDEIFEAQIYFGEDSKNLIECGEVKK